MAALLELRILGKSFKTFSRVFISNPVVSKCNFASSPGDGGSKSKASRSASSAGSDSVKADVPGLSKNVLDVPTSEVGPGASKDATYKNPEYFCYNNTSYFEAEVEMLKYRLPQPSSKSPATK